VVNEDNFSIEYFNGIEQCSKKHSGGSMQEEEKQFFTKQVAHDRLRKKKVLDMNEMCCHYNISRLGSTSQNLFNVFSVSS
jgi:hypothetical protein